MNTIRNKLCWNSSTVGLLSVDRHTVNRTNVPPTQTRWATGLIQQGYFDQSLGLFKGNGVGVDTWTMYVPLPPWRKRKEILAICMKDADHEVRRGHPSCTSSFSRKGGLYVGMQGSNFLPLSPQAKTLMKECALNHRGIAKQKLLGLPFWCINLNIN